MNLLLTIAYIIVAVAGIYASVLLIIYLLGGVADWLLDKLFDL